MAGLSPRRAYGALFFLTDESWALSLRAFGSGGRDAAFFLGSGLTMTVAWIGGSVLGRAGGSWLTDPARWGLDFAFTAVFVALLVGSWRGRRDLLPWAVAAGGRARGAPLAAGSVVHPPRGVGGERHGGVAR